MITEETLTFKKELVKYIAYLDSLNDYLQEAERKFVMKQHIERLVNETINDLIYWRLNDV